MIQHVPPTKYRQKGFVAPKRPRSSLRAFTLVELLVALVILGVLVSFIFSVSLRVKQSSANTKCLHQLRQIGTATFTYAADHDGILPTAFTGTASSSSQVYWNQFLGAYIGLRENERIGVNALTCPAKSGFNLAYSCYGVNYNAVISLNPGQSGNIWIDTGAKRLASTINRGTFIVADSQGAVIYTPLVWPLSADRDGDGLADSNSSIPYNGLDFRHGGRANFFLCDGSVAGLTSAQWAKNENNIWGKPQN